MFIILTLFICGLFLALVAKPDLWLSGMREFCQKVLNRRIHHDESTRASPKPDLF